MYEMQQMHCVRASALKYSFISSEYFLKASVASTSASKKHAELLVETHWDALDALPHFVSRPHTGLAHTSSYKSCLTQKNTENKRFT